MARKPSKKVGKKRMPGNDAMAVGGLAAAGVSGLMGHKTDPDAGQREPIKESALLQQIEFNYQDSPKNHGWVIEGDPSFSLQPGGVLDITARKLYSMHYEVKPLACSGRLVEFVAKYEARNTAVYPRVAIQNLDGSEHKEVWLKVQIGPHPPKPARGSHEWIW
jgi:hypothetical protein